jgi:hypothetical protein
MNLLAATALLLSLFASAFVQSNQTGAAPAQDAQTIKIARRGAQPSRQGPAENFTGSVRVDPLCQANASVRAPHGIATRFAALRFAGDYYRAPLVERPKHSLHETFKPSGLIGQGFGVAGGLFCILTPLYPRYVRKRAGTKFFRRMAHVVASLAGAAA